MTIAQLARFARIGGGTSGAVRALGYSANNRMGFFLLTALTVWLFALAGARAGQAIAAAAVALSSRLRGPTRGVIVLVLSGAVGLALGAATAELLQYLFVNPRWAYGKIQPLMTSIMPIIGLAYGLAVLTLRTDFHGPMERA